MNYPYRTKAVFIGTMQTGKTNIISRLTDHEFIEEWVSTLRVDFASKAVDIYDEKVICQIWDTVKSM